MCNAIDINEAEITLAPTMVPTEKPTSLSDIGEACTSSSQCAIGLVCHQESNTCTCNVETNEGCSTGNICGVYSDSGIPKCSCNMDVDDGENGCDPGQVSCHFKKFSCLPWRSLVLIFVFLSRCVDSRVLSSSRNPCVLTMKTSEIATGGATGTRAQMETKTG